MLTMEAENGTSTSPTVNFYQDSPSPVNSMQKSNEYFYILIVFSFYGVFLMGMMLVYIRAKRREKEPKLLLLYKDEEKQWMEYRKTASASSISRILQPPNVLNVLQESVGPAFSCTACNLEGSSMSSESSSSDVHLTIQEEATEGILNERTEEKNEGLGQTP
ncbi:potassium voltage-gated channel subfamily E member 4 [Bombina bombina]|uniref:potassium voltage-gated channel subfamily E member 4 n=1 Tax=Bombina bombina TaxID=8345 RepID=UPI00235AD2EC|nr:potassium voltage-gated channel subfamily E member 4 [Bombina bombina]